MPYKDIAFFGPGGGTRIVILFLGVLLLACGSSALNQFIERKTGALMPGTVGRQAVLTDSMCRPKISK